MGAGTRSYVKRSEKAYMCFKTRRASICDYTVVIDCFPDYLLADSKFVYLYLKMIQYLKILKSLFVHNCTNSNNLFYFYLITKNGFPPLSLK